MRKRLAALIILIIGLAMLAAGIMMGQDKYLIDFIKRIFEPSVAGLP